MLLCLHSQTPLFALLKGKWREGLESFVSSYRHAVEQRQLKSVWARKKGERARRQKKMSFVLNTTLYIYIKNCNGQGKYKSVSCKYRSKTVNDYNTANTTMLAVSR
ncbi:unnamed protein product [Orchesella dallaii]|uniref:Uncharacterized protein n=1 Tax=Orchesella dallaii TaxID=48710 RepID=A0ABP1RWH5_9HEXA